jgi:tetratricopeptide (TPR) repeat protein
VEDLHWAEPELLDLLERLVRDVKGPLLLVATGRPELLDTRPGWGGARHAGSTIDLEPLSPKDAGRMLDELLAVELPVSERDVIVERAEGNPLFVEELLSTLIDQGVLERVDGRWQAGHLPAGFAVPDSIQTVLAARMDLLGPAEKAALQAASVIGRVFWTGPVYELVEGLEPDFGTLEERDFIRRRSGSSMAGEREYAIKHALTREVAYGSVPRAKRARLHAAFAGWLERIGEARDEHASLLAYHYAQAVQQDADLAWAGDEAELDRLRGKAVRWLGRAAELGLGRHELREAHGLLEQALALEPDEQARIGLLRQVAEVHFQAFDIEAFRSALEEALALGPDPSVAARIYAMLAEVGLGRIYMWKHPPPTELAESWLAAALELAEPGTEARGLALATRALAAPEDGAEAAEEALVIAEALDSADLLLTVYEAKILVAGEQGRFDEACAWAERMLAAQSSLTEPRYLAGWWWMAGCALLRGGRVAEVPPLADENELLSARLTPHDEVHALALRTCLLQGTGQWEALAGVTAPAERIVRANEETPCQFNWRALLICALGLAHWGEEQEAQRLEELGIATAVVAGPPEREPALLRLALLRGDLGEAERILELLPAGVDPFGFDNAAARLDALVALGARDRVEEEAAPFLDGESYTRPFALRALGLVRSDRALTEEAIARFQTMGLAWHAEETRAGLRV